MYASRVKNTALLAAAAIFSGCAGIGAGLVRTPAVELTSVELTDANFTNQTFLLSFRASNPNAFPLPVSAISYTIMLNDQRFAGGQTRSNFTIPANGEAPFAISVELDLLKSGAQLTSIVRTGVRSDVDYRLTGRLSVDVPTTPSVSFSSSGTIMVQSALSSF